MYLAIDLGGTFLKYGVLDREGAIHFKSKMPSPKGSTESLVQCISEVFAELSTKYSLKGAALSIPCAVDPQGLVTDICATPTLKGINIKKSLETELRVPVAVENDANCAALAEIRAGCAQNRKDVILIVCGTGIGGAIIKDGRLHKGSNLLCGEFGMMINYDHANQNCEFIGSRASTGIMVNRASKAIGRQLTGPEVFEWAQAGNAVCQAEIEAFYSHLAVLLTNLQCAYDPELTVISGAISERPLFEAELKEAIVRINKLRGPFAIDTPVAIARFRNDAHLIGALFNFLDRYAAGN